MGRGWVPHGVPRIDSRDGVVGGILVKFHTVAGVRVQQVARIGAQDKVGVALLRKPTRQVDGVREGDMERIAVEEDSLLLLKPVSC